MPVQDHSEGRPLGSAQDLHEFFATAAKPRAQWRIGTEHEMIGVYASGSEMGKAPPYDGDRGVGTILDRIAGAGSWVPERDNGHVIALGHNDTQITLEPGGQLEHAARPVDTADEMETDLDEFTRQVGAVCNPMGIAYLGLGFRPFGSLDQVPWMPKSRYRIMRDYLPSRGKLAHEMMKRTATVQVNVDFGDGHDAREKLACIMSVTSLLTGIYAASPIVDGEVSDFQTYRGEVWRFTDPDRCGLLPFVFEDGCMFEHYTEWALDVPMFFVYRNGYHAASEVTFRQFMKSGFQGHRATIDDWELHLSTLFPEARLKRFIEVRGCDVSSREMILALGPLCRGILYDDTARAEATKLTAGLSFDERLALQRDVARAGLAARVGDSTVGELARELLAIATDGLHRTCPSEDRFLEPVREIIETGRTPADDIVDLWTSEGDMETRIQALAYPQLRGH